MSTKNSEFSSQKMNDPSSNIKPKKRHHKKNYFNSSSKKYQSDEKELSFPNAIIYNPRIKESPENEDEYKGLKYSKQMNIPHNFDKAYYHNEKEKSDEFINFKTKWKTEICRYWEMYGECKFGENCAFAHGDSELKQRKLTFNYKTKACKQFFELGYCSYGSRCQFSHKKESLEGKCEGGKKDEISYVKIINELNSDSKHISHDLIERPRLAAFENMAHSTLEESKSCKLKLYEDIINLKNENLNLKKNEMKKFKFSEDTLPNSNVNSDNNDIINGEE